MNANQRIEFIRQIRTHVANGDLDKAIEKLLELTSQYREDEFYDDALAISAGHKNLEKDVRKFLISPEDAQLTRNRLIDQSLTILQKIEDEPTPTSEHKTVSTHSSNNNKNASAKWLIGGVGALAFLIGGYFLMQQLKTSPQKTDDTKCKEALKQGNIFFDQGNYQKAKDVFIIARHECASGSEIKMVEEKIEICEKRLTTTTPDQPSAKDEQDITDKDVVLNPVQFKLPKDISINPDKVKDALKDVNSGSLLTRLDFRIRAFPFQVDRRSIKGRGVANIPSDELKNRKDRFVFITPQITSDNKYTYDPISVWMNGVDWRVYNLDLNPIIEDAVFNILITADGYKFATRYKADFKRSYTSKLPDGFAEPDKLLIITPLYDGRSSARNNSSAGLQLIRGKWHIVNENRKNFQGNVTFQVLAVPQKMAFVHKVSASQGSQNYMTYIDNNLTNGNPDKLLFVTPRYNSASTIYNPSTVGVKYDPSKKRWAIINLNRKKMPDGIAFNVLAIDPKN